MARRGILLLLCLLCATIVSCRASSVLRPVSEAHRSTALELFVPFDGSYGSLEDSYEALKTYQILGLDKIFDASLATCKSVIENLDSPSATPKDLYFALRVNSILGCQTEGINFEGIASGLQSSLKGSNSLLTYYYSIGGLLFIKALSQSDGRWRHDSDGAESSTYASGRRFEALAGVVTLADSNLDQSMVDVTTVFGAAAPPLTVRLVQAVYLNSADKPIIENQELLFDQENSVHYLDVVPLKVDVGKYKLIFEASFHYPEDGDKYTVGEQMIVTAFSQDFLGLVEKLYYLSGKYDLVLAVGDATMLMKLGVNLKGFPSAGVPAAFSILFHLGIAAVLMLYALFWLKKDS
ncbi:hypothetical protein HPP92_000418 [Vanilla planifolia]|uniref:Dolichyl-diphosphooligosaccharide--protein glycosyltransferase subunit 2 n=1 Tax=Vanilla planifolia TaxID=51239 RepID=A0A835VED8_VANPL|nr:hypothetical protein HPP92_000418 [Vanilla planifolia]